MEIQKSFEQLIKDADAKIKDAEQNFGQTQIRDSLLQKAQIFNSYKKYDEAIQTFNLALKKTIQIGKKMDIAFKLIQIYLNLNTIQKVKQNIDQCHKLLQKGGIYKLIIRDFSGASSLFVDVLPTFNASQVMDYETLVTYSVITGIISLDRKNIKKKILQASEVIVYLMKLPQIKNYLQSFYYCRYRDFFTNFLWVIDYVKKDKYLSLHSRFFIRQTRVVVYSQFLQSYKTVRLQSMANQFGVSVDFIDRELSELISARRLPCKIDKVEGIIETDPSDERNKYYKATLKKGDHLLNQIQKLSRAIDV